LKGIIRLLEIAYIFHKRFYMKINVVVGSGQWREKQENSPLATPHCIIDAFEMF
jgi:hypothetical protein